MYTFPTYPAQMDTPLPVPAPEHTHTPDPVMVRPGVVSGQKPGRQGLIGYTRVWPMYTQNQNPHYVHLAAQKLDLKNSRPMCTILSRGLCMVGSFTLPPLTHGWVPTC